MRPFVLLALLTPASPQPAILGLFPEHQLCTVAEPAFARFYRDFEMATFRCVPAGSAPLASVRPMERPHG